MDFSVYYSDKHTSILAKVPEELIAEYMEKYKNNEIVDMIFVIDTSGSMEGSRINSVKKTIGVLVETLSINDTITLVGFNSKTKIIMSSITIDNTNRNMIIEKINAIIKPKTSAGTARPFPL
jgi:Mg-chelatase subunit ChlD